MTHNVQLRWKSNLSPLWICITINVGTRSNLEHILLFSPLSSLFFRHLGRMSVRGLDPTCPSTIKCEPSSPSPSSQGDVSPAQPSPGSSSSDTNSSYGPLIKSHNHSNGLDSPGLYGHTAGLANNVGTNRLVGISPRFKCKIEVLLLEEHIPFNFSLPLSLHLYREGLGRKKALWSVNSCWAQWPNGCVWCAVTWPQATTMVWPPVRPARPSSRGPSRVRDTHRKHTFMHRNMLSFIFTNRVYCAWMIMPSCII